MTDQYAVIGHPISHSKSPKIHQAFAKQTGQSLEYRAIDIYPDDVAGQIQQLHNALKLKGLNVTVPFKETLWSLIDDLSERADRAGAVNTIVISESGNLFGDNTDGVGLSRDLLSNHGLTIKDKRILLLGAGGASRGVIAPLLQEAPTDLFIANRTAEKATNLANDFQDLGAISGGGWSDIKGKFDIVINATAASLQGEVPPISAACLADEAACYDMMYGDRDTAFVTWAKAHNAAHALDGLGMLVEQAAEAFFLWRGIRPESQPVIAMLRQ
ncbi:Shikimate 5-dehydrogenase I alpha [Methylophaga frappieri]|uniref:Shikimate dehydrogenase (NADP(+)) n=1 Tax=Methylophaga frappieri (strain ATCC BAA-2434 / DSM 25690 / JAM7) TaxID=754477 RepID=I1YHI2_METFJ|nr:shikimate dehydrogenase [Methylophaga frappieri]AFJ02375.1 Shikimate 5-dehydrogenase I alpha [Methylophaga frappieri]